MPPDYVVVWGVASVMTCVVFSTCIICLSVRYDRRRRNRSNRQQRRITRILLRNRQLSAQAEQSSIYNISGRVQAQNQAQYPDAYLSIEHITINNELNKPPKYDDAPPSYEEAIKLAMAQSNSLQTYEAEQAQTSEVAATTSIVTAVPAVSRATE